MRVASLSQRLEELDDVQEERVSAVVKRYSSIKMSDGTEMTPGQLLERFGFTQLQLKTPVNRLSGGQRRRLQILMVLLSEPNVLVLDEPTNDLDTDVLAALEDLLDSWPGTLIVVSHDRYLMERITDQQYAVLDGGLRHLPGGVDEYVRLSRERRTTSGGVGSFGGQAGKRHTKQPDAVAEASPEVTAPRVRVVRRESTLNGSERRLLEKELASAERRMGKIVQLKRDVHAKMADHDQADYEGVAAMTQQLRELDDENAKLEERWLALTDALEA